MNTTLSTTNKQLRQGHAEFLQRDSQYYDNSFYITLNKTWTSYNGYVSVVFPEMRILRIKEN